MILDSTLTKSQAESFFKEVSRVVKPVIYLKKLDCELIYRAGKQNDSRITHLRYKEDERPMFSTDKRTGAIISKRVEIITYAENGILYVLGKSGGVSLFDAMSPKLKLGPKDCWYFLPKDAEIPKGILIAKDVSPDQNGHFHYALMPADSMKKDDFIKLLSKIGEQMRIV